jgi:hypothetical protein
VASLRLRTEPTVHQVDVILERIEAELAGRGARVRRGARGELRFRMPPPWRAARAGALLLITRGQVKVSAGWGEPRRLRYQLDFATLWGLGALATLVVVALGWEGSRLDLLRDGLALWGLLLLLRVAAARRVRRMLAECAHEIVERRAEGRSLGDGG